MELAVPSCASSGGWAEQMGRQMSRAIEKSRALYLRTFADGEEIADRWTSLPKSGLGRGLQTLPLFSFLPSFPRIHCSLSF